jgi:hypothetical protein
MTPTAFCTTEVWKEIALKRAKSIRNMDPVIKAHPNWYCIEILDGFAAHFNSPEALQIYYDHKIIQVKEEGDSSQVNQTYDQCVARQDKRENNLGLSLARHAAVATRGVVDQWDLVDIALMAVREGVRNPSLWVNSAIKVNLHPFHRKSFPEWLEKIRSFLQGGQSFKLDQYSTDIYPLLSPTWHAFTPDEKKLAVGIFTRHGQGYHPACVMDLCKSLSIPLADMQKVRMGIEAAMKSPSHLEFGMPNTSSEDNVAPELAAAVAAQPSVTTGLINFELKPKSIVNNLALFEHMVQFRKRCGGDTRPAQYLDVPMTADQDIIINPTMKDLTAHEIMKAAGGEGATKKLAQRKLNNTGAITSHSGIQNQPERIASLNKALQLAASMAEIKRVNKQKVDEEKSKATSCLLDCAPAAAVKLLAAESNPKKLTKNEIVSVAMRYFNKALPAAKSKALLVIALTDLIAAQPGVLASMSTVAAQPAPDDEEPAGVEVGISNAMGVSAAMYDDE